MGSKIHVLLDTDRAAPLVDEVSVWFEEWEHSLSRFRLDSEVSRINAAAGSPVAVSQTVWDVLEVGLRAERITGGLVNPLVLEAMQLAGYDRPFNELEEELDGPEPGAFVSSRRDLNRVGERLPALEGIQRDEATHRVCLAPGTGLDLGGVAKGWAAHQAMLRLSVIAPSLVSAGGDVAMSGPRASGEPWQISLEKPREPGSYLEMFYLEGGGVATSGKDHRQWKRLGVSQHHIIDPRTGVPASTDVLTATVVAPDVMRAEALAKAALISGSEGGLAMLDDDPALEGVLVLDDGSMLYTSQIEKYL